VPNNTELHLIIAALL